MIISKRISSLKSLLSGEGETIFLTVPEGIWLTLFEGKHQKTGGFRYQSAD